MRLEFAMVAARAAVGFFIGLAGATAVQSVLALSSRGSAPIDLAFVQSAISQSLLLGAPLAMLPAMWYVRTRRQRPSAPASLQAAAIGVLLTVAVAGWIAPIGMRAYYLETIQRARQQAVERARRPAQDNVRTGVGNRTGAAGVVRRRVPTLQPLTPEQAVTAAPGLKTWPELVRASGDDASRLAVYRAESLRRAELAALAVVLAFLGWTLGDLHRDHALHAVMWWAMILLLTLATGQSRLGTSLVVFGLAAVLLRGYSLAASPDATSPTSG